MSNTAGTILRILWLVAWLITGWFMGIAGIYALGAYTLGLSFNWTYASIVFGAVMGVRMFYPRNVFV